MRGSPTRIPSLGLSAVSTVPMLAAGLLGGLTMHWVGAPLAMAFAIWSGQTTEPTPVDDGFWWSSYAMLVAASFGCQFLARNRTAGAERWGVPVAACISLVAAVLPLIWLWVTSRALG